jgi:hypothetical protein
MGKDLYTTHLNRTQRIGSVDVSKYLVRTLACALEAVHPPHTTEYDHEINKDEQLSHDRCRGGGGG